MLSCRGLYWQIIKEYKEDDYCGTSFNKALFYFKNNNQEKALEWLKDGNKKNKDIIPYLIKRREIETLPMLMIQNQESEAVAYFFESNDVWEYTVGALEWLEKKYDKNEL